VHEKLPDVEEQPEWGLVEPKDVGKEKATSDDSGNHRTYRLAQARDLIGNLRINLGNNALLDSLALLHEQAVFTLEQLVIPKSDCDSV